MKDYLFLNKMITPSVITFIYWLLLIAVVLASIGKMFGMGMGPFGGGGFSFGNFIGGLIFLVIGSVGVRVWCELVIVFFKMNENLENIKNKG